jgi:hypothetical protein
MLGVWIGLGVFLVCLVGAGAFAGVRGLAMWRQLKSTRAAFTTEIDRIMRTTGEIEQRLAEASTSQEALKGSLGRLADSRRQLMVQLGAVAEAQWVLRRLLPFLPK